MNDRELSAYESFIRVTRLVRRHPSLLEVAQKATALTLLEEVIAAMEATENTKLVSNSQSDELANGLEGASEALKMLMSALVYIAVAADVQSRTSHKVFRAPTVDDGPRKRIAMARAAADAAVPHAEALVKAGMPTTLIEDLRKAADAVEQLLAGRIDVKAAKTNASDTLPKLVKRGRALVTILESQLRSKFVGGMAAEFAEAKALGRVHRPKAEEPVEAPAAEVVMIEAKAPLQLNAGQADTGKKALPLWSTITQFFTRWVPEKAREPIVDVDYTIEEVERLPPPENPTG